CLNGNSCCPQLPIAYRRPTAFAERNTASRRKRNRGSCLIRGTRPCDSPRAVCNTAWLPQWTRRTQSFRNCGHCVLGVLCGERSYVYTEVESALERSFTAASLLLFD